MWCCRRRSWAWQSSFRPARLARSTAGLGTGRICAGSARAVAGCSRHKRRSGGQLLLGPHPRPFPPVTNGYPPPLDPLLAHGSHGHGPVRVGVQAGPSGSGVGRGEGRRRCAHAREARASHPLARAAHRAHPGQQQRRVFAMQPLLVLAAATGDTLRHCHIVSPGLAVPVRVDLPIVSVAAPICFGQSWVSSVSSAALVSVLPSSAGEP